MTSPATYRSVRTAERRAAALAAALMLVLGGLAGCGSDDDESEAGPNARTDTVIDISGTDPVGPKFGGSVAQLVSCADWKGADEKERLATIADIRSQLAPQDEGLTLPELTDEEAAEVFDNACRPKHAAGFRLYKLYAQAAAFVTLKRAADPE